MALQEWRLRVQLLTNSVKTWQLAGQRNVQTCFSSSFLPTVAGLEVVPPSCIRLGLLGGALTITGAAWQSETIPFLRLARRRPPGSSWSTFLNCLYSRLDGQEPTCRKDWVWKTLNFGEIIFTLEPVIFPWVNDKGNLPPLKQLQLRRQQQQSEVFLNSVEYLLTSLECLVHLLILLDCLVHLQTLTCYGIQPLPWQDHPYSLPPAFGVSQE